MTIKEVLQGADQSKDTAKSLKNTFDAHFMKFGQLFSLFKGLDLNTVSI